MKKALMMSSVASMIDCFNMDNIEILKGMGYEVDIACNFQNGNTTSRDRVDEFYKELENKKHKIIQVPVPRSILKIKDIIVSYKIIKKICKVNNYRIVHCHSPIGGVIARLACRSARKQGTKVIYTAHGFHFFKGASFKNWLLYYPVERICARFTDLLITINNEDYKNAQNFKAGKIEYVPGIGIDAKIISDFEVNRDKKRKEFGLDDNDFVLFSVGQLSKRKNHEVVIRALSNIPNKNVKLLICGLGELEEFLNELICKLGLENRVIIAGYRNDVKELLHVVDCFLFPSLQEGLPVALMEAMAVGLPIVCSNIRGNIDLIKHGYNGYLIDPHNVSRFASYIQELTSNAKEVELMRQRNLELVKSYDREIIQKKMYKIYNNITN